MACNLKDVPKIVYDAGAGDVTIQFEYPPVGADPEGKNFRFVGKTSEATNGNYQRSDNYTEEERNFTFKQVKESIKDEIDTFMTTFAGPTGKSFKYYPSSDSATFYTMQLSRRQSTYRPKRTGTASTGEDTFEFKLRFRRAL